MSKLENNKKPTCPTCNGPRVCHIIGEKTIHTEDAGHNVWADDTYRLLQCCGCETVFFQKEHLFSENEDIFYDPELDQEVMGIIPQYTYFPDPSAISKPDWADDIFTTDPVLSNLLDELYEAYRKNLLILTAIGLRTSIDRCSEVLGIDPKLNFAKKLDKLKEKDYIGQSERDMLNILVDAGSAAAHRGWRPKRKEIDDLIKTMEGFIYRNLVLYKRIKKVSVPPKQA